MGRDREIKHSEEKNQSWMNLRELCWLKRTNSKRLHTIWLHLINIFEIKNFWKQRPDELSQGLGMGVSWNQDRSEYDYKRETWEILVVMEMDLDYGGGYINLHMGEDCTELNTYRHTNEYK